MMRSGMRAAGGFAAAAAVALLGAAVPLKVLSAQSGTRTTNDAIYTAAQAKRGEGLYAERCAACHGQSLAGMEAAPALAGPGFSASWSGTPLSDLLERIRISMPQDKPGSLGRQQAADIVAYILSFNKAPAGQTELPGDADQLKTVSIAPVN
jgi:S-disulfanyl-L-cysteine oxidoreductase SoxD